MHFYKYQGTGNDFILIDNRTAAIQLTTAQIAFLCDRHRGIGADGLMLLSLENGFDFRMTYYNADGNESTMCGNGGRCITAFARQLGLVSNKTSFVAIDGPHLADLLPDGTIALHMNDVKGIDHYEFHSVLNTGSPHYILWSKDVEAEDVYQKGKEIRYSAPFRPGGINVNFVTEQAGVLHVRTYERGVENETLSCGTGVTAAAIASTRSETGLFVKQIVTPGGQLTVSFHKTAPDRAENVILTGPATFVFEGDINLVG